MAPHRCAGLGVATQGGSPLRFAPQHGALLRKTAQLDATFMLFYKLPARRGATLRRAL
jgi:hypothetical protein